MHPSDRVTQISIYSVAGAACRILTHPSDFLAYTSSCIRLPVYDGYLCVYLDICVTQISGQLFLRLLLMLKLLFGLSRL